MYIEVMEKIQFYAKLPRLLLEDWEVLDLVTFEFYETLDFFFFFLTRHATIFRTLGVQY